METTFISVHDLCQEATLLYASASIFDILGYYPEEVVGRSAFGYFHPDELPFARSRYGRGVQLDKAAVLSYCRIRNKHGQWVGCECVFTIVYDVLVASTSIYRRGIKSHQRALEAPIVRRLFASSPRDPRYNMLSHLSAKFAQGFSIHHREPRAALFLNRFTRTLSIMYATQSITDIFGITADEVKGRSFYYCIQENCLQDAIRCLESAKANDSIAYLRFWFRDPRQDREPSGYSESDPCDSESSVIMDEDDEDGGVQLVSDARDASMRDASLERADNSDDSNVSQFRNANGMHHLHNAIFDSHSSSKSSNTSAPMSTSSPPLNKELEIEAVVSCTSDGLVVVLRRARTPPPPPGLPPAPVYTNGLFASPWAAEPIIPPPSQARFSPALGNYLQDQYQRPYRNTRRNIPIRTHHAGPPMHDFMTSIRDVAAFAWSLTGINGSLVEYGRGTPIGESQPSELPIWAEDPHGAITRRYIKQEADEVESRQRAMLLGPSVAASPSPNVYPSLTENASVSPQPGLADHHQIIDPDAMETDLYSNPSVHSNFATHYNPQYGEYVPTTAEEAAAHAADNGPGGGAPGQPKGLPSETTAAAGAYQWL